MSSIVRSMKWEEHLDESELVIYAWCFQQNTERALLRIVGWPVEFQIELPGHDWGDDWVERVIAALNIRNDGSIALTPHIAERFYYYSSKPANFIHVKTYKPHLARWLLNRLKKPIYVAGLGEIKLNPAEHTIPSIRKFLTAHHIGHTSWFEVETEPVGYHSRISCLPNEYYVLPNSIKPLATLVGQPTLHPRFLVFDCEMYSQNPRAMPDSLLINDTIYLISIAYMEYGIDESRRAWVLATKGPVDITSMLDVSSRGTINAVIQHFSGEPEMFRAFEAIIVETDPDFVVPFNGHTWDFPYYKERMESIHGMSPGCLGRIVDEPTPFKVPKAWKSEAYGFNEEIWFDFTGRISLDLFKLIRRSQKLLMYNLKYITRRFLKKDGVKIDLSAQRQFYIHDHGTYEEWKELYEYSLRDAVCLLDLIERFDIWNSSAEMALIANVGIEDLYSRGQQIRMEACIYDKGYQKNVVINRPELPAMEPYEGAIVQNPKVGKHKRVFVFDFSSLYPSIMIAYNLGQDTFVRPGTELQLVSDQKFEIKTYDEPEDGKPAPTNGTHYFVKPELRVSTISQLLQGFLGLRAKIKDEMKELDKLPKTLENVLKMAVLNAQQEGCKVSANSAYGFLGANNGKLPLQEAAASVTAIGRQLITIVANYLKEKYGADIIYGDTDSVMVLIPDAPEDLVKCMKLGGDLAKEITKIINRPPIAIAFENIYERFIVFTKKMYIAIKVAKDGSLVVDEPVYKGVAAARREHSQYVLNIYKTITRMILVDEVPRKVVYDYLDEEILKMMTLQVPRVDCVMVKGYGGYSPDSTYNMALYGQQELLRGRPHKAGERCSIIMTRTQPGLVQTDKTGMRLRDPEDPDSHHAPIDSYYYINNSLRGPVTRMLMTVYGSSGNAGKEALPEKLFYSRKRKTEFIKPQGIAVGRRRYIKLQRGQYRPYIDRWLAEIRISAGDCADHVNTWVKLLELKERVCQHVLRKVPLII